jgi:hypothetical protein
MFYGSDTHAEAAAAIFSIIMFLSLNTWVAKRTCLERVWVLARRLAW